MWFVLFLVGTITAGAVAINTALHLPRARRQAAGNRVIAPRLSVRGLIDEAVATVLVVAGPFASLVPGPGRRRAAPAADESAERADDRPSTIVVLTGPWLPKSATWLLVRRLRKLGWPVIVTRCGALRDDNASIERLGHAIQTDAVDSATLVAVGAAGLVARQLATRCPYFRRILTIATPHRGTTAVLLPRETRPDAPYLTAVAEMDPTPRAFDAIAIYSGGDAWLEPAEAAYYAGAYNIEVQDIGHLSMLFSSRILRYIHENLEADLPAGN